VLRACFTHIGINNSRKTTIQLFVEWITTQTLKTGKAGRQNQIDVFV
jgi:hypothetical protein